MTNIGIQKEGTHFLRSRNVPVFNWLFMDDVRVTFFALAVRNEYRKVERIREWTTLSWHVTFVSAPSGEILQTDW